ncbi:MAG: carbohydrate ABC transporter permease [Acidobacteria bacterium]|nr:MAG: carbohydrate ABC transporter permease [Acidobacteriota bacterium]
MTATTTAGRRPLGPRIYGFLRSIPTWVLWILVVLWTIPTFGLLVNSLRTRDAQRTSGWWLAWQDGANGFDFPTLQNYEAVLGAEATGGLANGLLNSASIAIVATIIPIAIAAFAAYAFAWIDFRGREWLFIGTIALLAVPTQVSLIPLLQAYSSGVRMTIPIIEKTVTIIPDMGLAGTIPAVWLTHTGFALPFAIFLLHNYIAGLPKDLFESARIDGADHFKIFWKLVVPLSIPVLAAFAIFQFLWTWNDYLIALTMIGGNRVALPATVVVASLAGEFGLREHLLTAGAFVITVVPLVVFFALQRFFVRGITAGSVKG